MFRSLAPRRLGLIVVCALLAMPLAAAAQDEPASPAPTADAVPAVAPAVTTPEGAWQVLVYDPWAEGLLEPAGDAGLRLRLLGDGELQGATGCGRFVGGYGLEGEQLWLGVQPTGNLGCDEADTLEAVGFSAALDAVGGWRAGEAPGSLELLDGSGSVRVVLVPEVGIDPTGEWFVERYARANGNLTEPDPEAPMTVVLGTDGSVSGSTGCRLFEGDYRREGESIFIGPVETVGLPCDQTQRRSERRLLAAFSEAYHWQREGETLTLTDAFDQPLLVLRAVPSDPVPDAPVP